MTQQLTLSIIKPDAVQKQLFGMINSRILQAHIKIVGCKMLQLNAEQARGFYAEHQGKAFFDNLIAFMTSGPIIVQVLQGEDVIRRYRELMGATDPKQAATGTLRYDFAENVTRNAVHGSDSETAAAREIAYFFAPNEVFGGLE